GGCALETEMRRRAAALGLPLVETPITAVYHRARRSRFRPLRDGFAVGCYLTGHGLRRLAPRGGLGDKRVGGRTARCPASRGWPAPPRGVATTRAPSGSPSRPS